MRLRLLITFLFVLLTRDSAFACDPCALFNASRMNASSAGSLSLSLSEQLTSFESTNTNVLRGDFTKTFSTTQLTAAYSFSEKWNTQLVLPWVVREYAEVERFRSKTKVEDGLGDIVLLAGYSPVSIAEVERSLFVSLSAGVKFPTGDTGSLRSAANIEQTTERGIESLAHHQIGASTGLGGRILSIGSGSYDFPLVAGISSRLQRLLFMSFVQYTFRTEGDYDYRFEDDLLWSTSAGGYLFLHDDYSLALQAAVSGEHKGKDKFRGERVPGSSVRNIYVGPSLVLSALNRYSGELAVDVPVHTDADDFQPEPDYRLRAAFTARW